MTCHTREGLYQVLKNNSFSSPGATDANVEFNSSHDRKQATGIGILVQANSSDRASDEYSFTLLHTPERDTPQR
ncbi:hypothetical protein [Nostoc sp. CCY0012]|uniref:hypothetical protein n=1 Tax=Nostoc sp. CCY0012 TaxID=1056123 RepID=UPI0039C75CEC